MHFGHLVKQRRGNDAAYHAAFDFFIFDNVVQQHGADFVGGDPLSVRVNNAKFVAVGVAGNAQVHLFRYHQFFERLQADRAGIGHFARKEHIAPFVQGLQGYAVLFQRGAEIILRRAEQGVQSNFKFGLFEGFAV